MKKSLLLLPLIAMSLCACVKTDELYPNDAYNHTEFDLNYYTEWNNVDELKIRDEKVASPTISSASGLDQSEIEYAEEQKLCSNNSAFSYGFLSRLYDGRISCGGLYQKSRVQLCKTGFATFFPKQLKEASNFSMALRGGTTLEKSLRDNLIVDFEVSFYIHITNSDEYDKVTYKFDDVKTITDFGGDTNVYKFRLTESIKDAVAMSLTFDLDDERYPNLSDDYQNKEKEHFAIMLYEILLPDSLWF